MSINKIYFVSIFLLVLTVSHSVSVNSCREINATGSYILTQDLSGANAYSFGGVSAACIIINVSDVYFDCNNYAISNDGTFSATSILIANTDPFTNVTLINCNANGYAYGAYLSHIENSTLTQNNFSSVGYGIYAENTLNSNFSHNTIYNTSSPFIQLSSSSSYNAISDSFFNTSSENGVYFSSSPSNTLSRNRIINSSFSGVFAQSSSYSSILSNNFSYTGNGIYFQFSSYGTMDHNRVQTSTGNNFYLYSSSFNNITFNTGIDAYTTNAIGIYLFSSSGNNNISSNNITGSNAAGISLSSSKENRVDSNSITNSSGYGIQLVQGFGPQAVNNTISNNFIQNTTLAGIYARTATQNNYTSNTILDIHSVGINVTLSDYSILNQNSISNTDGDAIYLSSASCLVDSNDVFDFGGYGVRILAKSTNTISSNTFDLPSTYSIYLSSANSTSLYSNIYYHNDTVSLGIFNSDNVTLSGETFFGNAPAIKFSTLNSSTSVLFSINDSVFAPAIGLVNFTNLSISDSVDLFNEYTIGWATSSFNNYTIFEHKFIELTNPGVEENLIDSLTFNWLDSELTGYNEDYFIVMGNSTGNWSNSAATLSASDNILTLVNASIASIYGIFQNDSAPPSPPSSDSSSSSGSTSIKSLNVRISGACNNLIINVSDGSNFQPINDAQIAVSTIDDILSAHTDQSGMASLPICKPNLKILVHANSYVDYDVSNFAPDCSCTPAKPECRSDLDCSLGNICSQNKCLPKPPECTENKDCLSLNKVCSDQKCVQCAFDSDCGTNQFCSSNICKPKLPVVECTVNSDCLDPTSKICSDQKCVQCSFDTDCSKNQICRSNLCENIKTTFEISAPPILSTGKSTSILFTQNGNACVNCELTITDPTGKITSASTDSNGNYVFLPTLAGTYKISLLDSGSVVKTVSIQVASTLQPTSDNNSLILIGGLVISIILVGTAVYLIFTRKN